MPIPGPPQGEPTPPGPRSAVTQKETAMKGIIAYLLGVPIIVIILLYVTHVF
jgi:hypothetical protein